VQKIVFPLIEADIRQEKPCFYFQRHFQLAKSFGGRISHKKSFKVFKVTLITNGEH